MANQLYAWAKVRFARGDFRWADPQQNYQILLLKQGYAYSSAHQYVSDLAGNEVGGGGYTRQSLLNRTVVANLGLNLAELRCDDAQWGSMTIGTTAGAVIFLNVGASDTGNPLVALIDSGFPATINQGDLALGFDAAGAIQLT